MVSNVDLLNDIGKHIAIYPLKDTQSPGREQAFDLNSDIEGASFDFTASQYAWSIGKKASAVSDGCICIEPNDTVIIFTNEAISLDNYYAGACYSKLTFSMRGINHSSSPLKPGYTGRLSVSLHNDSSQEFFINIGETIVVIMLQKLSKPSDITYGNGRGSRLDILISMGISITDEERQKICQFDDKTRIMDLMKAEENYKKYKNKKKKRQQIIIRTLIVLAFIAIIVVAAYFVGIAEIFLAFIGGLIVFFVEKIWGK